MRTMNSVTGQATEAVGQAGDMARPGAGSGVQPSQRSQPSREGSDLPGRRSGADVSAADGSLVLATGQRIEQAHLDWAREHDAVDVLRTAADAWDSAERDRVVDDTVEGIRDAAGSMWDRFMSAIADMTDASGKRLSEQQTKARLERINAAVGRPVTKVILDRDDQVILNLGDVITHQAVQRAHEAGILDSLLDSVYTGEVSFERDEMKAPGPATSSVEQAAGGAVLVTELEEQVARTEQEQRDEAERRAREDVEERSRRDEERSERAAQRDEAARAAASEPDIPSDAPLAVRPSQPAGGPGSGGQVGAEAAGGTWMEEPDAPLASAVPPASAPEGPGGTWMERADEAATPSLPGLDEAVATEPVDGMTLATQDSGETASDAGEPLEPIEPHDAPAEGRSMDLPGADRDETLADVVLGDESHRSTGDLGGQPAAEVGLSDEGDQEPGEVGQGDAADDEAPGEVPDREDVMGDTPPGATNYVEAAAAVERSDAAEAETPGDEARRSLPDDPDAEMGAGPAIQGGRERE